MNTALLVFKSVGCPLCKKLTPTVNRLEEEHNLPVRFLEVTDTDTFWVNVYGVYTYPTLILLQEGVPVKRATGLVPYGVLIGWLEGYLNA
jgi:thiol-disulfide isomerase/thioredoxin